MPPTLFNHANARVAGPYLQPMLELAMAHGVSAAALCRAGGLAENLLSPLPESIAASDYVRLLASAAQLSHDPFFGLHTGQRVKMGTYNVYGLILLSCQNLGQVLQQTMRYEGLAHDLGKSHLVVDGAVAQYQWHNHFPQATRHLVESVFAGIRVFGHWLTGMPLPATRIAFCHARPDLPDGTVDEYEQVFGIRPEFGCDTNLAEFDSTLLQLPVPNADVSLYPVLRQHAEQLLRHKAQSGNDIVQQVRQCIAANLAQDQVRLPFIASELHITARTLQRKLAEAKTSFQQVLDQTRYQLACEYLQQPMLSLTDIAFLLGYQEQSSFNHAFRDWSGMNPGAWRAQN